MYIVKDIPIRKNKKTYGVGEEFPYSVEDNPLLTKGYLTEVKVKATKTTVAPKEKTIKKPTTKKVVGLVETKK